MFEVRVRVIGFWNQVLGLGCKGESVRVNVLGFGFRVGAFRCSGVGLGRSASGAYAGCLHSGVRFWMFGIGCSCRGVRVWVEEFRR